MNENAKKTVITLGEQVFHKTFGKGKIVGVKKEGTLMIVVQFANGRKKDLIYPHPAIQVGNMEAEKPQTTAGFVPATTSNGSHMDDKKVLRTVNVDKNYKFLNSVFGLSFSGYYKSVWPYYGNQDLIVWMVPFYSGSSEWKNELLRQNGVLVARETYIGAGDTWNGKPLTRENIVGKIRVVVGKESGSYRIYGVFKLGTESTGKCRIWKKIPDDVACKMVPEIYEKSLRIMNEKKIKYYSRTRWDTLHLYKYNTETGQFFWMDHCWTGRGQWVLRSEPYPDIVEISEERAMEISKGTLYTAPEFEK